MDSDLGDFDTGRISGAAGGRRSRIVWCRKGCEVDGRETGRMQVDVAFEGHKRFVRLAYAYGERVKDWSIGIHALKKSTEVLYIYCGVKL